MLRVDELHFAYGKNAILEGVTFSIKEGEIVALIGVSGSGKTTLFRLIAGLLAPLQGHIALRSPATYMRQEDLLLPWRTVLENLLLFSELGKGKKEKKGLVENALSLLEQIGLSGYEKSYPRTLSGGMRQRVALARSLLQNRPLMLLDEPFASLDVIVREQLYTLLRHIRDQYRKTVVMVTHDFRDAMALADRILVLAQGKIASTYTLSPQNRVHAGYCETLIQQIRRDLSPPNCRA